MSYNVTFSRGGLFTNTQRGLRVFVKEITSEYPKQLKVQVNGTTIKDLNRGQIEILITRLKAYLKTLRNTTSRTVRVTPDSRVIQFYLYLNNGQTEEILVKIAQFFDEIEFDQLPEAS